MRQLAATLTLFALPALTCAAPASGASVEPPMTTPAPQADGFDHSHRLFTEVLKGCMKGDWVDYRKVDREKLERYIAGLERVTPEALAGWTRNQRYAFWINVYNAHAIEIVLDHYPVESIKDIGGTLFGKVFDKEFIELSAHHPDGDDDDLSLNDVEHGILRAKFEDARVHAAVNCASYSCPPLRSEAFVAERLDEQLEEQMRAFVNDALRNRDVPEEGEVRLSKIFDWFEDDFERDAGSVRAYLLKYASEDRKAFLKDAEIEYLDYDWSLNDVEANRI